VTALIKCTVATSVTRIADENKLQYRKKMANPKAKITESYGSKS
jgi:hypothetical protein